MIPRSGHYYYPHWCNNFNFIVTRIMHRDDAIKCAFETILYVTFIYQLHGLFSFLILHKPPDRYVILIFTNRMTMKEHATLLPP